MIPAILAELMQPLVTAAVSAFGHAIMDMINAYWAREDAKALGAAQAAQAATIAAQAARDRMDAVPDLTDEEMIRRLQEGTA